MMKKGILYVVSAILLGVALMWTPLRLSTQDAFQQPFTFGESYTTSTRGSVAKNESTHGVTPHFPADEISLGLMSALSLLFAFAVFRQFKKKTA